MFLLSKMGVHWHGGSIDMGGGDGTPEFGVPTFFFIFTFQIK